MIDWTILVLVHVEGVGDIHVRGNQYAGAPGKDKPINGFQLSFSAGGGVGLRYMAHLSGSGDTNWVHDRVFLGSRDSSTHVEGFAIELTGLNFAMFDIQYKAYSRAGGETGWFGNGAFCGTRGQSLSIDAIFVKFSRRTPNYVTIASKAQSRSGRPLLITGHPDRRTITVDAQNNGDWQVWDKRPVNAGKGYYLISKADPNKCIVQIPVPDQSLVELSELRLFIGSDRAVWRDDTVPGPYNAINFWGDWESKFNMRGDPPYGDSNELLLRPWNRAADNELWLTGPATV